MAPIRTVVAGVPHLDRPDPVAGAAAELVRGRDAVLHLVHAVEYHGLLHRHDPGAEEWQAAPAAPGTVRHLAYEAAAEAVLAVAAETRAQLVLVGASRAEHPHGLLGGTAERVLRGAGCPVLVLRGEPGRTPRRLLLGTDLGELSGLAHERGLQVAAELFGAPEAVRSLLVIGPPMISPPLPLEAVFNVADAEMHRFLAGRTAGEPPPEPAVRVGTPAAEIVAEAGAWQADLVVLGTHGGVMLGSVAESVLRHAPCDVLVVPAASAGAAA